MSAKAVLGVVLGVAIIAIAVGVGITQSRSSAPTEAPVTPADAAIDWVGIPAGSFTMGCAEGDTECSSDEKPAHTVRITKAFQMAATETTNAQYRGCVEAGACKAPYDRSAYDDGAKANHPVVTVDWNQARAFCTWVGGRLPTEAEWEYAARGGKKGLRYPWGNEISHDEANFDGTGGKDTWAGTSPVKSFSPNGFGLFDMAGNVWEWCEDWYDGGYYAKSRSEDPKGPGSGSARVLRGGSWGNYTWLLRVSLRYWLEPGYGSDSLGFRCSRDAQNP